MIVGKVPAKGQTRSRCKTPDSKNQILYILCIDVHNYEMKIVLARLLSRVSPRSDGDQTVRVVRRGITFAPSGGVPVIASMNRYRIRPMQHLSAP